MDFYSKGKTQWDSFCMRCRLEQKKNRRACKPLEPTACEATSPTAPEPPIADAVPQAADNIWERLYQRHLSEQEMQEIKGNLMAFIDVLVAIDKDDKRCG